jgi:uncharacterized protein with PQ loop repeat
MSSEFVSHAFSIISLCFYSIVYLPQFKLIFTNKSSEGVSIYMFILWSQADCFSLLSTILIELPLSTVIIGWYHFVIGVIMILFSLYYTHNKTFTVYTSTILFVCINILILLSTFIFPKSHLSYQFGQIIGWFTTILYIIGRIPQIHLNFKNKSTEGLSSLMYLYTIIANICYLISILAISTERNYIISNMFIVVCVVITVLLDIFVIYQTFYYHKYDGHYKSMPRFLRYYC